VPIIIIVIIIIKELSHVRFIPETPAQGLRAHLDKTVQAPVTFDITRAACRWS
jgi:hypothetical protein